MKIARHVVMLVGLAVVLVCSWLAPMDSPAMEQVDAGLKRALVSFATARTLNGVISIIQATQVDVQPGGLGVTLSPGQMLAPVNELVKHFADLMMMAGVAFAIQKLLITISGYMPISLVLTVTVLVWVTLHLRHRNPPEWLSKALVLMLMLRFAIPVAVLGTEVMSQKYLAAEYTAAQTAIDVTAAQASKVKAPERPNAGAAPWWSPKLPNWLPSIPDVKSHFVEMKDAVERATGHMVKLIAIFLLQTLVVPLLLLWGLYGIASVTLQRPRPRP
ncbi:MAG TPA: hypothetical protein VIM63_12470 [Rhodoferax sp.]